MPSAEELNKEGMEDYRAGRIAQAIQAYEAAIEQRPDYIPCLINLSLAYIKKNREDDAINAARRAVDLAPEAAQARYCLANAFSAKGRWNEAATEYVRAFELDKGQVTGLLLAGNLLMDHGLDRQALETWKRFLAAAPADHPRRAEAQEHVKRAEAGPGPFSKF